MILGMSTSMFTLVHVVLSLVGIFAGLVVLFGMTQARGMPELARSAQLNPATAFAALPCA